MNEQEQPALANHTEQRTPTTEQTRVDSIVASITVLQGVSSSLQDIYSRLEADSNGSLNDALLPKLNLAIKKLDKHTEIISRAIIVKTSENVEAQRARQGKRKLADQQTKRDRMSKLSNPTNLLATSSKAPTAPTDVRSGELNNVNYDVETHELQTRLRKRQHYSNNHTWDKKSHADSSQKKLQVEERDDCYISNEKNDFKANKVTPPLSDNGDHKLETHYVDCELEKNNESSPM